MIDPESYEALEADYQIVVANLAHAEQRLREVEARLVTEIDEVERLRQESNQQAARIREVRDNWRSDFQEACRQREQAEGKVQK